MRELLVEIMARQHFRENRVTAGLSFLLSPVSICEVVSTSNAMEPGTFILGDL
jgi:hypothetical protein